jgi:RNA polymerase sigma factor (sigma-70 family)
MAGPTLTGVLRYISHFAGANGRGDQSDADLLRQFVADRDEGAFVALLQRHGPLVFGVCRQVLDNPHDAEDAFQATFLVLARKAGSIRRQESLATWLYRVALNISRRGKTSTSQQQVHERQAAAMSQASSVVEEVYGLPEKYRVAIVLCYLKGRTHEEAARELGWPLGTVKGRLARARDLLRSGLARRGLTLSGGGLTVALTESAALGQVPVALLGHTLKAAVSFASGMSIPAGMVSAQALALAKGALHTMAATKALHGILLLLAIGLLGLGVGFGLGMGGEAGRGEPVVDQQQPNRNEEDVGFLVPDRPAPQKAEGPADPLVPGAIARMGSGRFRHGGPVSSMAYLANGKLLASGGYVGTIWDEHGRVRVWETETGKEIRHFHLKGVANVTASPDGRILAGAGAGAGTIYLWDASTGQEIRRLQGSRGFDGRMCGLAFSPDGKTLAYGGRSLHVWQVETGNLLQVETDQDHPVLNLAFSADGKLLAAARVDETDLQLYQTDPWKKLTRFRADRALVAFLLPDHKTLLAVAGENSQTIDAHDLAAGNPLRRFEGHHAKVHALVLSPNGKTLASVSADKTIRVWDVATGKHRPAMCRLPADRYALGALTFAPDGKTLAWANSAGQIKIWDLATGTTVHRSEGHQGVVSSVLLSPDSKTLFSAGTDGTVRIWDALTGKELRRLEGHEGPVASLALSPDGTILASVSPADRTARLWDLPGGKQINRFPASPTYCDAAWLPDSKTLAIRRYDDQALYLHDIVSGNVVRKIEGTFPSNVFAYPDHSREAAHSGGLLAVAPDGKTLATCTNFCRPTFQLWETGTGKKRRTPAVEDPEQAPAASAVFSPDSKTIFTSTYRTVRRWDIATGKQLQQFIAHEGKITCMALSGDGKTLALTGSDPTIRLWDIGTAKECRRLAGHQGKVTSLCWSADGSMLASGSADGTALLWNVKNSKSRTVP